MKKKLVFIGIFFLFLFICFSGCTEEDLISEVLNDEPDYIVVAVDANVRINGHQDLWDPIPGVPVKVNINKAGGEYHEEIRTTDGNGETGIVHASFNVYKEQPVYVTAFYYGNKTYAKTETLGWNTIKNGANEVGMYSWSPMVILVVDEL